MLKLIRKTYPEAEMSKGKVKEWDIYIPETDTKIECKYDKASYRYGNLAFEFECSGKPSGIAATESEWWVYQYHDKGEKERQVVWFNIDTLKKLCFEAGVIKPSGDRKAARCYIIPIKKCLEVATEFKIA